MSNDFCSHYLIILTAIAKSQSPKREAIEKSSRGELYMSSKQWLARHGLKAKKIGFYDFLQTLAFKHCDGVVDIQHPPTGETGNAVRKFLKALYTMCRNMLFFCRFKVWAEHL